MPPDLEVEQSCTMQLLMCRVVARQTSDSVLPIVLMIHPSPSIWLSKYAKDGYKHTVSLLYFQLLMIQFRSTAPLAPLADVHVCHSDLPC